MLICFTSDLHGSTTLYTQLHELLHRARPDLLILGGDLLADGRGDDPVASQLEQVRGVFLPRLAAWRAEFAGLRIACLNGNHDWGVTADVLAASEAVTRLSLDTPLEAGGVRFLGYHCTPWTPYTVKDFERRDLPDDPLPEYGGETWDAATGRVRTVTAAEHFGRHPSIAEELAAAPAVVDPWIFVCHAPPHDTALDRLPQVPHPIGSRAVRRFIEQRQPLVSLHGHVHESAALSGGCSDRLGRTLCINPGQSPAALQAVCFDTDRPAETLRHTVLG